ncbi:single-stranded DNA-binding protein [Methylocystis rosea]|uniref:single-stranded DNA-binding protein n=1 Tax=Methylocystis rosea TaxID=173366 RepID=UPI00036145DC|nr:single-stranded DNA-binding protein [Methylocystis rosea]
MTARALVTGTLFRAPERKVSRGGKPYVSATIRVREGDASQFWRVTIFSESAGEEMMSLSDGDAVSAQGAMRAELYRPDDGEPRLSLSIIADQVLALRQPARKREKQPADAPGKSTACTDRSTSARPVSGHRSPYAPHGMHETDRSLDDDIPF